MITQYPAKRRTQLWGNYRVKSSAGAEEHSNKKQTPPSQTNSANPFENIGSNTTKQLHKTKTAPHILKI